MYLCNRRTVSISIELRVPIFDITQAVDSDKYCKKPTNKTVNIIYMPDCYINMSHFRAVCGIFTTERQGFYLIVPIFDLTQVVKNDKISILCLILLYLLFLFFQPHHSGGGAGGSLYATCDQFLGSPTSMIYSNGGNSGGTYGGGGAGGRITVYYNKGNFKSGYTTSRGMYV